jgi:hypothetical protein
METFRTIISNSISLAEECILTQNAQDAAFTDILPAAMADLRTSLQNPDYWLKMDIPPEAR